MEQKKKSAKKIIREIKRNTRRKFSAEEKILKERARIKQETITGRERNYYQKKLQE